MTVQVDGKYLCRIPAIYVTRMFSGSTIKTVLVPGKLINLITKPPKYPRLKLVEKSGAKLAFRVDEDGTETPIDLTEA